MWILETSHPVLAFPTFLETFLLSPWRNMLELNSVSRDYETPATPEPEGSSSYLTQQVLNRCVADQEQENSCNKETPKAEHVFITHHMQLLFQLRNLHHQPGLKNVKSQHQFQLFNWNANKSSQIATWRRGWGRNFGSSPGIKFGIALVQHLLLISQQQRFK